MQAHKFGIGAVVEYRGTTREVSSGGAFAVERQMPADADGYQYQIHSLTDGHRRVVHEGHLVRGAGGFARRAVTPVAGRRGRSD